MLIVSAQLQRLAVLPSALKITESGASFVPSLCLDFFREGPNEITTGKYSFFSDAAGRVPGNLNGVALNLNSYSRIAGKDADKLSEIAEALFLSTENDLHSITRQKTEFLNARINYYRTQGNFDHIKLRELQEQVWAFDILEMMGYTDQTKTAMDSYRSGLTKFAEDFLDPNMAAKASDVTWLGEELKRFKNPEEYPEKQLMVYKSQRSANYIVFNDLGKPVYRGQNQDELARALAARFDADELVEITNTGFSSELTEKAFMVNLQRKLRINYKKDIMLTTDAAGISWLPENYRVTRDFSEANITPTTANGNTVYKTSVELEPTDDSWASTTVEGRSNRQNLLSRFFENLMSRIRAAREAIILGKFSRDVKRQVIRGINLTNEDFLDVIIIGEGGAKDVVRIRKGHIEIIPAYAIK